MKTIGLGARIAFFLSPALCIAQEAAVPAYVLEIPESVSDVLIADTDSSTLYRFGRTASGIANIDERYMSIGQNGVGKEKAWDRKTPLGVYFITEELDTTYLDAKYGVAAYSLDYPNPWDRYQKRTGDGIWLHGVDANGSTRPPKDTDGCLALPNDEILTLAETLKPFVTPVIVARELVWSTPEEVENQRIEFRIALEMWRHSLEQSDFRTYSSLYADAFSHRDIDEKAFEARSLDSVKLDDVLLIADPEVPGLYLSRFTLEFVTDIGAVRTTKRLYWMRRENRFWEIVAEGAG